MPFITQGKANIKYIFIVVVSAVIAGGGILGYYYLWMKDLETRLAVVELKIPGKIGKDETAKNVKELDLSTPEKTLDLYIEAIRNEDLGLIKKLYSKKQQQDLVERNVSLMQEAINEGKVLWKVIFFLDEEQEDFVVERDPMHSGYANITGKETYNRLYSIDFNVGSREYSVHFVFEDSEWLIPGSWDTYDFEK